MTKTTLFLIDDHAVMRMGLVSLLRTCKELEVVGDAGDGASGIVRALKLRPQVIIMDLAMPRLNGVETTRRLLAEWPDAKVLILTTFGTSDGLTEALNAGARGVILKSAELKELRQAIATVASGDRYVSEEIEQLMTDDPPVEPLSPRQTEILRLLVRGLSNTEIAKALGISLDMVREHTSVVFRKLGAANRTEAVAIALRKQLLKM